MVHLPAPTPDPTPDPARVRRVQGIRRSGAAGPHGGRRTRAAALADALADQDDPEHDVDGDDEVDPDA